MSKVLAHRGYSGKYPENTMIAFEKAMEYGCDGFELDVQLTADNVPVIIHDEKLDRTTDSKGFLHTKTYDQIKRLNAAAYREDASCFCPIPKLVELFDLVRNSGHMLNVELKNNKQDYPGIEESVIKLIREYKLEERCVLSSFRHTSVIACRAIAPEINGSLITSNWLIDPLAYLIKSGIKGFQCVHISVEQSDIESFRRNGITSYVWTPNTKDEISKSIEKGVDYLITNEIEIFNQIITSDHRGA